MAQNSPRMAASPDPARPEDSKATTSAPQTAAATATAKPQTPPKAASGPPHPLALRWILFNLPEVRLPPQPAASSGSTPQRPAVVTLATIATAIAALPVLPEKLRDPSFIASLNRSCDGFVARLIDCIADKAAAGSPTAAGLLSALLSAVCATYGGPVAVERGLIDRTKCVAALLACRTARETMGLAATLQAFEIATRAEVLPALVTHAAPLAHVPDQWSCAHAAAACEIAAAEIDGLTVTGKAAAAAVRSATASRAASTAASTTDAASAAAAAAAAAPTTPATAEEDNGPSPVEDTRALAATEAIPVTPPTPPAIAITAAPPPGAGTAAAGTSTLMLSTPRGSGFAGPIPSAAALDGLDGPSVAVPSSDGSPMAGQQQLPLQQQGLANPTTGTATPPASNAPTPPATPPAPSTSSVPTPAKPASSSTPTTASAALSRRPSALGMEFPSRVPNSPTPWATAIVAASVVTFRIARMQFPVLLTVNWLALGFRMTLASLEHHLDAVGAGRSLTALATAHNHAYYADPAAGGGSTGGGSAVRPGFTMGLPGFGLAAVDQTSSSSSTAAAGPAGGGGASSSAAGGGRRGHASVVAAAKPDRPMAEAAAGSLAVTAIALLSLVKRRNASKLASGEALKPVPHPSTGGKSSSGSSTELVNLHDGIAFLALRAAAVVVEPTDRARCRFAWSSGELDDAPVAFLHLAAACLEFLTDRGLPLSTETQKQLAATLAVLIRASGVGDAVWRRAAANSSSSINNSSTTQQQAGGLLPPGGATPMSGGQRPQFVDPNVSVDIRQTAAATLGDVPVAAPSAAVAEAPSQDGIREPVVATADDESSSYVMRSDTGVAPHGPQRAMLMALRAVDMAAQSLRAPPATLVAELRGMTRQLELCAASGDPALVSAVETALALSALPDDVLSVCIRQQQQLARSTSTSPSSQNNNANTALEMPLLGWIPSAAFAPGATISGSTVAPRVPVFHIDQGAWGVRAAAAAFRLFVASTATGTAPHAATASSAAAGVAAVPTAVAACAGGGASHHHAGSGGAGGSGGAASAHANARMRLNTGGGAAGSSSAGPQGAGGRSGSPLSGGGKHKGTSAGSGRWRFPRGTPMSAFARLHTSARVEQLSQDLEQHQQLEAAVRRRLTTETAPPQKDKTAETDAGAAGGDSSRTPPRARSVSREPLARWSVAAVGATTKRSAGPFEPRTAYPSVGSLVSCGKLVIDRLEGFVFCVPPPSLDAHKQTAGTNNGSGGNPQIPPFLRDFIARSAR